MRRAGLTLPEDLEGVPILLFAVSLCMCRIYVGFLMTFESVSSI